MRPHIGYAGTASEQLKVAYLTPCLSVEMLVFAGSGAKHVDGVLAARRRRHLQHRGGRRQPAQSHR